MAKLKFETTANLKPIDDLLTRIKELEQHIASLKKEMRSINAADPKIDPLLKDLKASKEEINNLVAEINRIKQAQLDRQREQEQAATREKESIASLLRAYEELRQKVADTANKSTSPSSGANNAPSIKEETQAYDELLSKIRTLLGSREETIASMLREENAIRLIKKELKGLQKLESDGINLTEAQRQRRIQLTSSLEEHKQSVSQLKQILANEIKSEQAVRGSMNEMSQSLGTMRMFYRTLNEEERNTQFGQELLKRIQLVDTKIKELDASIGNHQRNVGNYASHWDSLGFSIQQVARELPSISYGLNVFFGAISNNLPILADDIRRAIAKYKAAVAEGKAATPVWKQIVKSIFSWQTALVGGITLLTLYGNEIADWVEELFKGKKQIDAAAIAQEHFHNAISKGTTDAQREITKLDLLYKAATDTSKAYDERRIAIEKLQKEYPAYFGNMDAELIAAGMLKNKYDELRASIIEVSKAKAAQDILSENQSTILKIQGTDEYKDILSYAQKIRNIPAKINELKSKGIGEDSPLIKGLRLSIRWLWNSIEKSSKEIGKKLELPEDAFTDIRQYIEALNKANEKLAMTAETLYTRESPDDKNNYASKLQKGQNKVIATRESLAEILKANEAALQNSLLDIMAEGQEKELAQLDNATREKLHKIEEARQKTIAAYATKGQEPNPDELAKLDETKANDEKAAELARVAIVAKYARQEEELWRNVADVFLSEEARKRQGVQKTFDEYRRLAESLLKGGSIGESEYNALMGEIGRAEKQAAFSDLLQKYQSYTDKRLELERLFDKEEKTLVANRTAENADTIDRSLNELARRRAKELAEMDYMAQAGQSLWGRLFDNYSSYTNKQLQEIIVHAQQVLDYVNNTKFEDISPRFGMSAEQLQNLKTNAADLSAAYDALGGRLELLDKQNPFGAMIRSSQLLKKNTAEIEKAERELAKAQASGDKQAIEDAQKKLEGLQRQQALLKGGLKSAAQAATSYLGEVGDSLQRIGEAAGDADLASFGKALSEVSNIADRFISGDAIGGVISTITTGLSAIFSSRAKYRAALKQMHDDQIAFAHEYRLLLSDIRLEAEGASNAFSDDIFAKGIAALKEMSDLYENFLDLVNKDEGIQASRQGPLGKIQQIKQEIRGINTDLQNIWIQTRHGTWFRSAKGEYLKDLYPELFEGPEELGGFNVEAARALLETNNQLNDEAKRQLQEVVDLYDQWQEAEDQFKEYLNSTFGEIGDSLGDSIVEAFKNGTDAMEAWGQSFNNVLEKVGKQMMQTLFFQKYFDQLEADLTQLYNDYGDDPNVLATKIPELLGTFFGGMDDVVGKAENWWKTYNKKAKEYGFDLLGNDTEKQSATSRGFQTTMSQDTGNELSGRFSDLQMKGQQIIDINTGIRNIASELRQIQVESLLELRGINENTGNTVKVLKKIDEGVLRQIRDKL
ncbi:hypothetical protein [Alistipes ihumii]|uniref:hypothetical protein n=1 Tax=Alistipes ihumii TaxID=1470347 RepID=UPI0027BAF927|nr:hypothetical protein [Alistipes ihumii]